MKLPRFLQFKGYDVKDFKEYLSEGRIEVHLEIKDVRDRRCNRCKTELSGYSGQHRMKIEGLPIMGHRLFIYFWRSKGFCVTCKKHRSERVHFLSELSPHYTKDCPVRAAPAQNWPEFKSTSLLKVTTPAPSAFFSTLELSV
jgi:transposase